MSSITNNIYTNIYPNIATPDLCDGKNKSDAPTSPPSNNPPPSDENSTSPSKRKLTALCIESSTPKKAKLESTPPPSPQNSDDYPNLTPEEKKMIHEKAASSGFPRNGYTEQEFEKYLDQQINAAKGQVAKLLGKKPSDISINDNILRDAVDSLLCWDKSNQDAFNNFTNILNANTPDISPEEEKYASQYNARSHYAGIPGDVSGNYEEALRDLIRLIDAKTGKPMSKDDIDRLWEKFRNYVIDHHDVQPLDAWKNRGTILSDKDFNNLISDYILSDSENADITKYAKEYNVPEDLLRQLAVNIDEKTGGHMSDEDIKKLAESLKQDQDEGKDIGTSDQLGAESLQLIEKFSTPPPTNPSKSGSSDAPTGDISPEEQEAIKKCAQDLGISEKTLRTMVSIIDKQTGKHMSEQAIQQLAEGMPS